MDPVSRRHVWELVTELKHSAAVILTTHSMEEADILGDRVAIMARGRLRAIGTPIHLKQQYGAGYSVNVAIQVQAHAAAARSRQARCSRHPLADLDKAQHKLLSTSLPTRTLNPCLPWTGRLRQWKAQDGRLHVSAVSSACPCMVVTPQLLACPRPCEGGYAWQMFKSRAAGPIHNMEDWHFWVISQTLLATTALSHV